MELTDDYFSEYNWDQYPGQVVKGYFTTISRWSSDQLVLEAADELFNILNYDVSLQRLDLSTSR